MEEFPLSFRLLLLPGLLGINGFFAAAEVALVSVRETRMRQLAEQGNSRARAVLGLLENPDRLLSATQLGVTLASLGLGWAGEETVYRFLADLLPPITNPHGDRLLHLAAFAVAFLIITFLHMVIGEVVPKNLAFERTERLALAVGAPLELFARATHFFVHTVEVLSEALSRLLGLQGTPKASAHSIEELKLIVTASRRHGLLPVSQENLLHHVIDFYDLVVREIMVPRNKMVSLSVDSSRDDVIRSIWTHRHSRIPVWEGSPEHIIGILYSKDLWPLLLRPPLRDFRLRAWLHPHRVVPETKPLHQLLPEFQQQRFHMALVVDEFGTIVGLVTVEDVVEQIVGEIRDEHDLPEPGRAGPLGYVPGAPLELDGIANIRDLDNLYGISLPYDAGFETLAGFLLERLGAIPRGGEQIIYEGLLFTVLGVQGHRIARVRVEKAPAETAAAETPSRHE